MLLIAPPGSRDALVELLNAGAEDYLIRPFELRELTERIEILQLRFGDTWSGGQLRHKAMTLDLDTFGVRICSIRRKLREITPEPYIEIIWGVGFRLI